MIGVVLFDLDNTLIDRQLAYGQWVCDFAAVRGLGADAVQVLYDADEDGFASRQAVFETARQKFGLAESVQELIADYRAEYPKFFQPDDTVLDALQRLREHGFCIAVVTNGPPSQREKLERAGLLALLDGVCISEEYGIEKPDPRIFVETIRRCCGTRDFDGIGWMIGDSPDHDIAGGKEAGLQTVWLSRGRTWTEPDFAPDFVASGVTEAINLILSQSSHQ
jgi:HAD superfamily hydrolase (TIGR01549 family)